METDYNTGIARICSSVLSMILAPGHYGIVMARQSFNPVDAALAVVGMIFLLALLHAMVSSVNVFTDTSHYFMFSLIGWSIIVLDRWRTRVRARNAERQEKSTEE